MSFYVDDKDTREFLNDKRDQLEKTLEKKEVQDYVDTYHKILDEVRDLAEQRFNEMLDKYEPMKPQKREALMYVFMWKLFTLSRDLQTITSSNVIDYYLFKREEMMGYEFW